MTDSNFYLGRAYDPIKQTVTAQQATYDPADLTTHAVVTGMTGSGKTEAGDFFKKNGYEVLRFGSVVDEIHISTYFL